MSEVVAVIDYGMGNLHSAGKALEKVASGQQIVITGDPAQVRAADRVVFPGVGAIRDCIAVLRETGLDQAILDVIAAGKPVLGICVGMQALMARSEENNGVECLGVFDGQVTFFGELQSDTGGRLKVPHMGWNQVRHTRAHPLLEGVSEDAWFYFVHSYRARPVHDADVLGVTRHGLEFASVLIKPNIFAVQFHPEKSQGAGMTLLANFVHWDGQA